ncbi:MAG: hypothetical protein J6L62_03375 [Clostridia bacterium]|nr:hypothetical protein [Clostridia bacterium]
MKKKTIIPLKKALSVFMATLFVGTVAPTAIAATGTEKNFIIESPYEEINWDEWGMYKTQLHCHTTASDGFLTIDEFCKMHYACDYDIVALTDHGTLNRGWNVVPETVPLMRFIKKERTQMADIIPIPEDEYQAYLNGTNENKTFITSSGYNLTRTSTNGMIDIPLGIELNMATPIADCHLTGYYAEYGQGLAGVFGDYETPTKGVKEAGGISMLSHVGEYVYTDKDSEKYVGQKIDEYYVNKFARLFLDNQGSSLGMGINSATDAHTRCDRILYDQILQKTIPYGVVPWGNTFADSHNETSINDAYTMSWMPNLTTEDFRTCLEKGQFFSISHFSNGVELDGIPEIPGFVEQEVYDTERYWLDNTPNVTRLTIDQENDTITVEGVNFDRVVWVSNGNVIQRDENVTSGKATLDLHADSFLNGHESELFVRFYLTGENGICYSQPMVLHVEGEEFEKVEVPETHDISTFLRGLVTVIDAIFFRLNPIIWIFKYFGLGYNPLTWDRITNPF